MVKHGEERVLQNVLRQCCSCSISIFFKDTDEAVKCLYKLFEQDPTKSICKSAHYLTKIGYKPE